MTFTEVIAHEAPAVYVGGKRLPMKFERLLEEISKALEAQGLRPVMAGGAAQAWQFPNGARTNLLNGTFDIDTDTYKCALFTSGTNLGAATTTYAGVTSEVAAANGYTTGGIAVTLTLSGTTTVTVDIATDPTWNASGGAITARYAAIYEVGGNVLCYSLLDTTPADVSAPDGNPLTVAANASGVFTLA